MQSPAVGIEMQLRQLRAAAAEGPFTDVHYNQVASILNQDTCTLQHGTAALHTVTLSLQSHPHADPSAPPPGLLPSGLLPAIFSLCQRHPKPTPSTGPTVTLTLFAEAVASMLDTLLQPPINLILDIQQRGGTPAESARQILAWMPVWLHLSDIETSPDKAQLCTWTREAGATPPDGPFVESYRKEWATVCPEVLQEAGQPASSSRQLALPGTHTVLAMGCMAVLGQVLTAGQKLLDGDRATWRSRDPVKSVKPQVDRLQEHLARKFVAGLEQDAAAFPLPHGAWPTKVADYVQLLTADFCDVLLASPKALRNLARPLTALAEDVSLWQTGAHTHHVQLLDDICRWAGSVDGTLAVQKLAQQLVQPLMAALDSLLEQIAPDDRKGAAYLVQTSIRVMTHLAATDYGRTHMASSGCLPRWLELAPRWRRQPGVLRRLLLLATTPCTPIVDGLHTIWTGRLLTYLSYEGKNQGRLVWPEFTCGACPDLLRMQVVSSRSIEALAALMEGDLDPISWCFALRLVQDIQDHHPAALKPLIPALLAFAKPRTPPLAYPAKPGSDLKHYLMHGGSRGHVSLASSCSPEADQLSALNIACCLVGQAGPADAAATSHAMTAAAGMSATATRRLAEWLEVLQQDGRAEAAGGLACFDAARTVSIVLGRGLCSPEEMSACGMDRIIIPGIASLLPHVAKLGPTDNGVVSVALASAFDIILQTTLADHENTLPWQHVRGCSFLADLPARLAKGPSLAAVLQHLQNWALQLGVGSGRLPAGAMVQSAVAGQTLSMLGVVACCWGPSGQEGQACRLVLEAKVAVWGLFKLGLAAWAAHVPFIDPWLHFLYQQLQQEKQPKLQRLAKEVLVEQLGEKVVGQALRRTQLPLPWKQYETRFAEVFKEAASKARPAARVDKGSADHSNQRDQNATGSRKSTTSSSGLGGKAASSGAACSVGAAGRAGTSAAPGQSASNGGGAVASSQDSQPGSARECCHCQATPEDTFLCGRCNAARYCSKECQRADWKTKHKLVCKQQP